MAVPKVKVIERLKALFPKANLSQKRLDALADKLATKPADDADDSAIDDVINDFNQILSIEEIAKDDDRLRTLESKQKEPKTPVSPQDLPAPTPPKEDIPEWAKQLISSNQKTLEEIEAIKTGKVLETKRVTASELFSKSNTLNKMPDTIKTSWLNRIDLNSETAIEDQVKSLEEEYAVLSQTAANNTGYSGPAGSGNPNGSVDEKLVEKFVNEM
ncbi:hypothetical protein JJC03_09205 [Flavobacterium oreochromis]|uniref:hypothetical protein n=1 Tax=Flavobacterium oreochromis TaxID=2906078 RepID=UPI001CE4E323|nr:hypothetical protein [Flavobacterium oreochromis]QYS85416.1 hypothetical protein JJC03_09205 [Flavobacterium oreochromis]